MDKQTQIEERISQLIRTVDELSDVVARQDREISQLQARVGLLVERAVASDAEAGHIAVGDQRPPHY